ncbi:hypothetical protein APHAL10511_003416 [Amanita phalloides]|nr:hypothetical protein APHAL10511_003416 [Amanita phalloides]
MGEYDATAGTLLLGIILNTYLFGIVTYQFISYYSLNFNDTLWIKATVFILLIVDVAHSISLVYMAWLYLVSNFDNPSAFLLGSWPYCITPILTAVTTILTQHFMAYRIYQMTKNRYLYVGIMAFSLADFIAASVSGAQACQIPKQIMLGAIDCVVIIWLAGQAILDFFLACFTSVGLYRRRTDYYRTNRILNRCIRSAIQIGFFSTTFAIANLVAFLTWRQANLYGMFAFPIGRIYTNAIMDTLIVRASLRDQIAGAHEVLDTDVACSSSPNGHRCREARGVGLCNISSGTD